MEILRDLVTEIDFFRFQEENDTSALFLLFSANALRICHAQVHKLGTGIQQHGIRALDVEMGRDTIFKHNKFVSDEKRTICFEKSKKKLVTCKSH